jgi:hypothetical protein
MLYVEGMCPHCTVDVVGFRRCTDGATIVLMCGECGFVWLDPARRALDDSLFPDDDGNVPGTPYVIGGGASGWATRAEVERAGWGSYIFGEEIGATR